MRRFLTVAALAAIFVVPAPAQAHHGHPRNCSRHHGTQSQAKCFIQRACKHYRTDCTGAIRVAWCESKFGTQTIGTGHLGLWQFDGDTWNGSPYRRHSPHSLKWSSYAAMWYWHHGEKWRWSCL